MGVLNLLVKRIYTHNTQRMNILNRYWKYADLSLSLGVPHFSSLDLCCRRAMELSLVIRQTLEAAILTHLMPRSQVKSLAGFVPREWTYLSGLVCSCNSLSFLDL
jgi:hypothetical protein